MPNDLNRYEKPIVVSIGVICGLLLWWATYGNKVRNHISSKSERPLTPIVIQHMATSVPAPRLTPTLAIAQKAVQSDSASIHARYLLGLAYYKTEHYEQAINTFKTILPLRPDEPRFRYWLACSYMGNNALPEAINTFQWFTQDLSHNPNFIRNPHLTPLYRSKIYAQLSRCYYDLYDDQEAEAAARKALQIDKNEPCAQQVLTLLHKE